MQRRICLAEVFAETSHAEEDLFSGGVCRNKSCRGGFVQRRCLQKQVMQRRISLAEVFSRISHAEEDLFSGGVCRNKSCRGGFV